MWRRRRRPRGQSVVEFALVFPLLLLMVVAIADFGRVYVSMVAVESAAREAADFGSFTAVAWSESPSDNRSVTLAEMERRACTAAAGSHLEGYSEPAGTIGHATCTNPTFSFALVPDHPSCADELTEPPCVVMARMDYDFTMFLAFPPLPGTIHIARESRFRMQDLQEAPP